MRDFLIALAVALAATPLARALAVRAGVLDHPAERKLQREAVPYLGGLAVLAAFVAGGGYRIGWQPLVAAGVLAVMGLVDDIRGVGGLVKFTLIMPAAVWMWIAGYRVEVTGNHIADLVITLGWYAGVTNAVNFLDNTDGLASGTVAILAGGLALLGAGAGAAAMSGALLGFLFYNRAPARIYLGDAGSNPVGLLVAVTATQIHAPGLGRLSFLVAVVVCGVPITDTFMISASRISRRLSPLHPGRDHFSHRLLRSGLSVPVAVAIHWTAGALCVAVAAAMVATDPTGAWIGFVIFVALASAACVSAWRVPPADD